MLNNRTTRLLIVLFVGLLAVAYLVNLVQQNKTVYVPYPTPLPEVFPGIDARQITHIELENPGWKRKIVLDKVPGDWVAKDGDGKPIQVDLGQVTRMIQILPTLRYNRVLESTDLKAFGLADGGLFVLRFSVGNASYTLRVGDPNSAQTYSYIQRGDGGPVLQADMQQVAQLVRLVANPNP
jgi:hypothetical protein